MEPTTQEKAYSAEAIQFSEKPVKQKGKQAKKVRRIKSQEDAYVFRSAKILFLFYDISVMSSNHKKCFRKQAIAEYILRVLSNLS